VTAEIIDSHTHVDEVPALGWMDPPEKIIGLLDEAGIARAVIMTYTELPGFNPNALEYIADAVARHPDRLIGYVRLHPWFETEAARLLRQAIRVHRMKGLKLHPVGTLAHPADASTLKLIRLAAELGAPVLFHCGDEPMTTPLSIAVAAAAVPEATVILGHMGGYFHVDEAIEVAERHPNVLLETSAMPYPRKIAEAVARVGSQRVLFASDGPGCRPDLELAKVRAAGLPAADLDHVLGGNIRRLLDAVRH
jgi:predicted TIM-barrel fold metal-dependent hydrolase